MPTHQKLSFIEKYQVMERLLEVCTKDPDGFAVYGDGYDDHILAEQMTEDFSFDVNASHVAHLRRNQIGNFRRVEGGAAKVKASDIAGLSERIASVEKTLVTMTETLATVVLALEVVAETVEGDGQEIPAIEAADMHGFEADRVADAAE